VYKNTNSITSLIPVSKGFSNFHIVKEFEVINFDGLDVGFISWINPQNKEKCLKWISSVDANVLCGHFEINNFEIITRVICTTGLDSNLFDRFTRVFSGHFHIKAKQKNIYYVGNPYQTNWGEHGYKKGFHIYDTLDDSLEFIKNPVDIYQILCYNDSLVLKDVDVNLFKNKIVRVLTENGKSNKKQKLELLIEMIGVVSQSVELIEDKDFIKPDIDVESIQSADTAQLINSYLESSQIPNVDKKLLQDLIFGIYREALERGTILV
jgi:DNA repair exonuclease SbcCD nuclease subunit